MKRVGLGLARVEVSNPPHRESGQIGDRATHVPRHHQQQGADRAGWSATTSTVPCSGSILANNSQSLGSVMDRRLSNAFFPAGVTAWRGVRPCRRPYPGRRRCRRCRSHAGPSITLRAACQRTELPHPALRLHRDTAGSTQGGAAELARRSRAPSSRPRLMYVTSMRSVLWDAGLRCEDELQHSAGLAWLSWDVDALAAGQMAGDRLNSFPPPGLPGAQRGQRLPALLPVGGRSASQGVTGTAVRRRHDTWFSGHWSPGG